jgi:hypothetical protein
MLFENLPDLRKALKTLMALETEGNWSEAQHFHKRVFVPSCEAVAERMGITRSDVRKLL